MGSRGRLLAMVASEGNSIPRLQRLLDLRRRERVPLERFPVSVLEQALETSACSRVDLGHQRRAPIGVGNLYGV